MAQLELRNFKFQTKEDFFRKKSYKTLQKNIGDYFVFFNFQNDDETFISIERTFFQFYAIKIDANQKWFYDFLKNNTNFKDNFDYFKMGVISENDILSLKKYISDINFSTFKIPEKEIFIDRKNNLLFKEEKIHFLTLNSLLDKIEL